MAVFIIAMSSLKTLRSVAGSRRPTALIAFLDYLLQSFHLPVGSARLHEERVARYANSAAAELRALGHWLRALAVGATPRSFRQAAKRIAESA